MNDVFMLAGFIMIGMILSWSVAGEDVQTSPPLLKKIVVENIYYFTVSDYIPSSKVALVKKREESNGESPEATVCAFFSAMSQGDHEWWLDCWSKDSRSEILERDKKAGRGAESWRKAWATNLANRSIELNHKIVTGDYVIIEYKSTPQSGQSGAEKKEQDMLTGNLALKKENLKWVLTQELKNDPVLHFWKNPESKPQYVIRK